MLLRRLLTLSIVALPLTAAAAVTIFSDVPESAWYSGYVHQAMTLDIVSGYRDANGRLTGKFGPGDPVTVAQSLKMAVVAAGYDTTKYSVGDAWLSKWYGPYVGVAQTEHFSFFIDRKTDFDIPATRGEVAQIVADAFRVWIRGDTTDPFRDVPQTNVYASAIAQLSADGVISGDTDSSGHSLGTFRPNDPINRAEAVKIIMKAHETYGTPGNNADNANDESMLPKSNPDAPVVVVVTYRDDGFSPSEYHIAPGTTVRFENHSQKQMWVASDPHPVHTDHPNFDEQLGIAPGESYSFTFRTVGTYGYHNHLSPGDRGTVYVAE